MRTSVPENTVFDTDPAYASLKPAECKFMKLLLLAFADQKNIQTSMHMSDTETIDILEGLIKKGAIQIVERTNGDIQLTVTPTSAVEAFFAQVR
jgi:hypothetical protein